MTVPKEDFQYRRVAVWPPCGRRASELAGRGGVTVAGAKEKGPGLN